MKEYADFLGSQPPYDALGADELERLVHDLEVEYFAAGSTIVQADGPPLDHLWVVRTGAVEVVDRGRVVDHLGPGDTFGHISVLTGLAPALSVRALEDSLCLRLPDPRSVLHDASRLRFSHFGTMISRERLTSTGTLDHTPGSARSLMRPLVMAEHDDTVADVARRVTQANHSAALVRRGEDWGVVTDHDFRRRVATGEVSPSAPVGELASYPAIGIGEDFSQAAAFSRMIDRGVHHLVVLDARGVPEGVVRAVDFASAEIRNPLQVRSLIDDAEDVEALRAASQLLLPSLVELGHSGVPAPQIGSLHASIVDALLRKLVALHGLDELGSPPSWIVLGSMARREPLPHSDVDTAMVWAGPAGDDVRQAYLDRAEALLVDMETCGMARCDNGANAVNPLFARSADEWAAATARWLSDPLAPQVLLLSSIVIDSRPLTEVALGRSVTDVMRATGPQPRLPGGLREGGDRGEAAHRLRPRLRGRPSRPPPGPARPQAGWAAPGGGDRPLGRGRHRRHPRRDARPAPSWPAGGPAHRRRGRHPRRRVRPGLRAAADPRPRRGRRRRRPHDVRRPPRAGHPDPQASARDVPGRGHDPGGGRRRVGAAHPPMTVRRRRLRGPALDVPWREVEYVVVDVETTGLDLRRDVVISFGSVLVRAGRLCWGTRTYLPIRPERAISESAMRVHGLRQQDLESAPLIGEVADELHEQFRGRVLVAHAAWVEQAFLGPLVPGMRRGQPPAVDTAALLRATGLALSGTGHEPDVEDIATSLGLCVHTPHHALGDAVTTGEVFLATVSRLERSHPELTAATLVDISRRHSLT